jgi:hypothetical protein
VWVADPDSDQSYLELAVPPERLAQVIEELMMHRPRVTPPSR